MFRHHRLGPSCDPCRSIIFLMKSFLPVTFSVRKGGAYYSLVPSLLGLRCSTGCIPEAMDKA